MAIQNFTGKNIQDTYPRVVQTDGTNLADGTGSLLPIEFNENNVVITGSLSIQASGHITSSGNISASGEIIGIIDGGSF